MSSIWTVRRSATDTKVAGLCGGVAEHWGIDPVLVRVGWVLLALSGGVGVVLYLAGWLLIPLAGQARAPLDDLLGENARRWPKGVWVALVAVACLAVFATFGTVSPFGVGPAVILAAIWYFGFYRSRRPRPGPPPAVPAPLSPPAPATPFAEAVQAWQHRIEEHAQQNGARPAAPPAVTVPAGRPAATSVPAAGATAGSVPASTSQVSTVPLSSGATTTWPTMPAAGPASQVSEPDPELASRTAFLAEPDPVGLYTAAPEDRPASDGAPPVRGGDRLAARRLRLGSLAVLGLALAGLGLADRSGVTVVPAVYAATALLVVGLTLVAATWLGRARGLLPLGLLLVPVVLATTVLGPVTHLDSWTERRLSYASVAQLPAAGDQIESGQLLVDLSQLPTATDASYTAHVGTGRLAVVAPADSNVVVDYRVGVGAVQIGGQQVEGGTGLSGSDPAAPVVPGARTLTLHLSVDRGQVEVRR